MSKLLIDDNPLQVLPKLAEAIGLNEAIVVQQLHYWLNKSTNEHDGKKWVYNTYAEWKETNFPFWSVQVIGNIFRSLEEIGLVVSKQINKKDWDRRKWYTLNYKELTRIENEIIERMKIIRSIDQKSDSLHITETTTETTLKKGRKEKKKKLPLNWIVSAGEQPTQDDVDDYLEETEGKRWKYRETLPTQMLPFADLTFSAFGQPKKRDLMVWMEAIGDWISFGCNSTDFVSTAKASESWDQPAATPKGYTKTMKAFSMRRKKSEARAMIPKELSLSDQFKADIAEAEYV